MMTGRSCSSRSYGDPISMLAATFLSQSHAYLQLSVGTNKASLLHITLTSSPQYWCFGSASFALLCFEAFGRPRPSFELPSLGVEYPLYLISTSSPWPTFHDSVSGPHFPWQWLQLPTLSHGQRVQCLSQQPIPPAHHQLRSTVPSTIQRRCSRR